MEHGNDNEVWQDELHQTWVDELSQSVVRPTAEHSGIVEAGTEELVDVFLSGGTATTTTSTTTTTTTTPTAAGADDVWRSGSSGGRTSLHACMSSQTRFRAAAASSRPGGNGREPESEARFWAAAHGGRPKE